MNEAREKYGMPVESIREMLIEMRDNCANGKLYDDPKRMKKMTALNAAADIIMDTPTLNTLRDEVYADAVAHGLWEDADDFAETFAEDATDENEREAQKKFAKWYEAAKAVWLETEEMLTAVENYDYAGAVEELADAVIICMSAAGYLGIDIDAAVRSKMEINKGRPWKHKEEGAK